MGERRGNGNCYSSYGTFYFTRYLTAFQIKHTIEKKQKRSQTKNRNCHSDLRIVVVILRNTFSQCLMFTLISLLETCCLVMTKKRFLRRRNSLSLTGYKKVAVSNFNGPFF